MQKTWLKLCSMFLVIVMVFNMLPMTVWAEEYQEMTSSNVGDLSSASTETDTDPVIAEAQIVGEVIENRTEYSKEFRLDNGLIIAAVYTNPVHYQDDGEWKDIDNTLVTASDGTLTNTAGVWNVSFPQQLSRSSPVTITKDGYTLSFVMAGELRYQGNLEVMSAGEESAASVSSAESSALVGNIGSETALETASVNIEGSVQTFAISSAQLSTGTVQAIDLTDMKEAAKHEALVAEKNVSQLLYTNVYSNTNVQYDLQGNKVKESIILNAYDSGLRGYRYTLNVGDMVPVLYSDGGIEFYDAEQENIVMYMPAPYLVDQAQEYSYDINVSLTGGNGVYTLTYILPTSWLASSEREWPVVLDPAVTATANVLNIRDHTVAENGTYSYLREVLECGYGPSSHKQWIFLKYRTLPSLDASDVILEAEVSLYKPSNASIEVPVNVHKVLGSWESETLTWGNKPKYDTTIEDYAIVVGSGRYYWDITDIAREWYSSNLGNTGMMFKAADAYEDGSNTNTWKQFASADNGAASWLPSLTLMYRDSAGLESYWDYSTASAGRAGTGYVNSYTGNLVWTRSDLGFGGNRMPVSINHVYNLCDAASNDFGLGYGWRTNFNQRITSTYINSNKYYIWEDADGTRHYFWNESYGVFKDEDGLELTLKSVNVSSNTGVSGGQYSITDKMGNVSVFDSNGRLIQQNNNQATKSSIKITYTSTTSMQIDKITDGAGRVYDFVYSNNLLNRINYYGTTTSTVYTYISILYDSNNNLTSIMDKDVELCLYSYNADGTSGTADDHVLITVQDVDGYKLQYSYYAPVEDFQPFRVSQVKEYFGSTAGGELNFEYAHNQTALTDHNGNVEIMQFNNFGNVISIQDDEGHAQHANYTINNTDETGKANQLKLSSRMQNTVVNLLQNSSFEGTNTWTKETGSSPSVVATQAYLGSKSLAITNEAEIKSEAIQIPAGATYTFSAYVKTGSGNTAKLTLRSSTATYASNVLGSNSEWTRLETSYTNSGTSSVNLTARLVTTGTGTTYMDCVQVEKAATASRYNLVQNGDFRTASYWSASTGRTTMTSGAPQLSDNVYQMIGDPTQQNRISQTITVPGSAGDNFVLAGWAKGDSAPLPKAASGQNQRQFALIGTFIYSDGSASEQFIAQFNPDTNVAESWQYVAEVMVAAKAYTGVKIEVAYDYNVNTVYFDGIQLFKEQFGSRYYYDGNGNVTKVEDTEGQETKYEYTNNNLTKEVLPTGVQLTYTYDNYHNVTKATTSDGQIYNFTYDTYGNNTSVSITNSSGVTMTSEADYTDDGKLLESTKDAAGNITYYTYDPDTNLLLKTQYPGNNANTYTQYTYDNMYRTATAKSYVNSASTLSASYIYNDDLLKSITTNSTTYTFNYGAFSLRSSVKIGSRTLASYTYTSDRNNYLQKLAYGNSDSVQYTYDDHGRLLKQTYEDGDTVTYQYDNDGALAAVMDSDTGITTKYYYDFSGSTAATELRKGADIILRVSEGFDNHNRLTEQNITFANDSYKNLYTYNANGTLSGIVLGRATSATSGGLAQITYTYDGFLRLSGRSSGKNSQTYTYYTNGSATTSQVTQLKYGSLSSTPTFNYTYDAKGNIATYAAPNKAEITYTYDANNQLTKAQKATGYTYTYTYDNAGNITKAVKNGVTYNYTYGDSTWKDLLTAYNGSSITYDTIGNPTKYYNGWNFTWEHGREMATATNGTTSLSFKYDANGLRTSKTVNGVEHTYYYYGGKLLRETYDGNTLDFYYDASGVPYMLEYNGTVYYYVTNAQGDVIRIVNSGGTSVADYEYDPYGASVTAEGTLATINPLRYRGYVYDVETGLYYVSSRYYDPEIGRWINADAVDLLGANGDFASFNLFTYCGNNPISRADSSGYLWTNILIGAVVGAVAGVVGQVISDVVTSVLNGEVTISNWQTYTGAAVGGAAGGVVLATTGNMNAANAVTGAVTTGVGQSLEKLTIKNYNKSWAEIGVNAAVDGAVSYGLGKIPGIKGATAGRNSWSAVYKSGLTKLRNGTAARMSAKVVAKGLGSSIVGGFALDGYYGVKQHAYDRVKCLLN